MDPYTRFAEATIAHLRSSEDFQREQAETIANVLQQIIEIVGFEPGPPYDEPLFRSFYSVPRLLEHVRAHYATPPTR